MPLYSFGSGGGNNFANADLTLTGDRTHDLAGSNITLSEPSTGFQYKPDLNITRNTYLNGQIAPLIKLDAHIPNNGTIQDILSFEWNKGGGTPSGHGIALVTKGETSQRLNVGTRIFWDNARTITTDYFLQGINHNTQNFTISSTGS